MDWQHATWRKSSRSSGGGNGDCVEIAELDGTIGLRDSKDPHGPMLMLTIEAWRAFTAGIKSRQLAN